MGMMKKVVFDHMNACEACVRWSKYTTKIPTNREPSILGIGGLCKNLKIPTLPPKSPMSGVTLHFVSKGDECSCCWLLVMSMGDE